MNYQNLSYVKDEKGFIYQIYGLIQPKDKLLCQISYIPYKENINHNLKQKLIGKKKYIKWTPLVDLIGLDKYAKESIKILPTYIKLSHLSPQIVEVPLSRIVKYFPSIKLGEFSFSNTNKKIFSRILSEFNLNFDDVYLGGLFKEMEDETIFTSLLPLKYDDSSNDFDFYIYNASKAMEVKKKLLTLRQKYPHRFNVYRGNTKEKIPHRISCTYISERKINVDFLFSPSIKEIPEIFKYLSDCYHSWTFGRSFDSEITIDDDQYGFSFPQLFLDSTNKKKLLVSAHRYDWLNKGIISAAGKILNTSIGSFFLVEEYGKIQGIQVEDIK